MIGSGEVGLVRAALSDVFLSYSREDRDRIAPLVHALEKLGLSVWWDRAIDPGARFDEEIDQEIQAARCVIVAWSKHSIGSQWVRSEALEGLERDILVPILLDDVRIPVAFKRVQAASFIDWPRKPRDQEFEDLIRAVEQQLSRSLDRGAVEKLESPKRNRRPVLIASVATFLIAAALLGIRFLDSGTPALSAVEEGLDPTLYRQYLLATDRFRRGNTEDLSEVTELLGNVTQQAPRFARAHALLCRTFLVIEGNGGGADYFQRAEGACDLARQLDPEHPEVLLASGSLWLRAGRYEEAASALEASIAAGGSEGEARVKLGDLHSAKGEILEAEKAYLAAIDAEPRYLRAINALGSFYFRQGMYFRAAETFEELDAASPGNARTLNNLGAVRLLAGDFEGASEAWQEAVRFGENAGAYSNMGYAEYLQGNFETAAEFMRVAVSSEPESHQVWGNLGDVLRFLPAEADEMREAYTTAISLAEQDLAVNPNEPNTLARLSVYNAALGEAQQALAYAQRAEIAAANDFYVLLDLSVTHSILGRRQQSEELLDAARRAGLPAVLGDAEPQFLN